MSSKKTKSTDEATVEQTVEVKEVEASGAKVSDKKSKDVKPYANLFAVPDRIWDEIKDLDMNLFAMPQKVSKHFVPMQLSTDKLYLKYHNSATLPALEETIGDKYDIQTVDMYIVVSDK